MSWMLYTVVAAVLLQVVGSNNLWMVEISVASKSAEVLYEDLELNNLDVYYPRCSNLTCTLTGFISGSVEERAMLETIRPYSAAMQRVEQGHPLREKLGAFPGYSDLEAITSNLTAVQNNFPAIAKLHNMEGYGPGTTVEGRTLLCLKISDNVEVEEDEANVLVLSMHHSREIVTPLIALEFIARMTAGYGVDAEVTKMVNENEIFVCPVWNPDGYVYTWDVDNMWRKNRKLNAGGSYGVDQNRNYEQGWHSSCAGSTIPTSQTFKGTAPNSEEETQILVDFAKDRRFHKVIDFHSSGREVLYSVFTMSCTPIPAGLDSFQYNAARELQTYANYINRRPSGAGQHQQWHFMNSTSYSFLIETHTMFQPSFESALQESDRVAPLIDAFIGAPPSVTGTVVAASNGSPIAAKITIDDLFGDAAGINRQANERFGRFNLFTNPGRYIVEFSAEGYATKARQVTVEAGQTVDLSTVQLAAA